VPYTNYPQVQDILNGVTFDVRSQLSQATSSVQQSILIDYTNRIHKQMLRFSRWNFLLSEPLYFLTEKGQSKYWLGSAGNAPAGQVDTGLNLPDVDKIKKDSVIDISNIRALKWLSQQPYGPNLQDRDNRGRENRPTNYIQNPNDPQTVELYPPPDNENITQPRPQVPITLAVTGGALAARTYFTLVTYVDSKGGETTAPPNGREQFLPADFLMTVKSPAIPYPYASSGVLYNRYNVYAGLSTQNTSTNQPQQPGSLTLQNVSPIAMGTDFTEPTSGLTTTGQTVPTQNSIEKLGAYIIKFQYYKARKTLMQLSDFLQVPEDYKDVVIMGVTFMALKLLGKNEEAMHTYSMYQAGLREMIWDKNLFPEGVEFVRPDSATFVNQQILGWLPFENN
jgi:hypothetical protein